MVHFVARRYHFVMFIVVIAVDVGGGVEDGTEQSIARFF
jgi:hypothetical protein